MRRLGHVAPGVEHCLGSWTVPPGAEDRGRTHGVTPGSQVLHFSLLKKWCWEKDGYRKGLLIFGSLSFYRIRVCSSRVSHIRAITACRHKHGAFSQWSSSMGRDNALPVRKKRPERNPPVNRLTSPEQLPVTGDQEHTLQPHHHVSPAGWVGPQGQQRVPPTTAPPCAVCPTTRLHFPVVLYNNNNKKNGSAGKQCCKMRCIFLALIFFQFKQNIFHLSFSQVCKYGHSFITLLLRLFTKHKALCMFISKRKHGKCPCMPILSIPPCVCFRKPPEWGWGAGGENREKGSGGAGFRVQLCHLLAEWTSLSSFTFITLSLLKDRRWTIIPALYTLWALHEYWYYNNIYLYFSFREEKEKHCQSPLFMKPWDSKIEIWALWYEKNMLFTQRSWERILCRPQLQYT